MYRPGKTLKKNELITVGDLREFLEHFHEDDVIEIEVDDESHDYTIWEMTRRKTKLIEGKHERVPLISIQSDVKVIED